MTKAPISQEEREEHRQCELETIVKISETESKMIQCKNNTEYRVKRFGEKKYLKEGGDPSDAAHYETEQTEATRYLCRKCFEHRYLYAETQIFAGNAPDKARPEFEYGRYTGKWMFRRFDE